MADIVTGNEFLRMQNDAVNRVRQMQQRADSYVKPAPPPHRDIPAHPPEEVHPRHQAETLHHHENTPHSKPTGPASASSMESGSGGLLGSLLGGGGGLLGGGGSSITGILDSLFNGETDKLLILGLIWLLSKEKADQMLIMALFYILM